MLLKTLVSAASVVALSLPTFDGFSFGDEESRIIKLGPDQYQIATESEKLQLKRGGVNFIDITNQISIDEAISRGLVGERGSPSMFQFWGKQINSMKEVPTYNYPTKVKHQELVNQVHKSIETDRAKQNLAKFTSFRTRYYKAKEGAESAQWLYDTVSNITAPLGNNATITKIHHDGWDQFSIVLSIAGNSTDKVVVGAHQDSANFIFPLLMAAPGADDDGSGTVTVLEALQVLVPVIASGDLTLENTLEFHFYSAEEAGLLGSIDVFSRYSKANEVVVGMLQQDMTGYTQGMTDAGIEEHMSIITDYTNVQLNQFIKLLIDTYNDIPYVESTCGYACSDHGSALENGYPSAFVIEASFEYTNKYIHSTLDTLDRLNFNHIKEHIKLTVAYAVELSSATNLY